MQWNISFHCLSAYCATKYQQTNKVTINCLRKEMHSEAKLLFLWRSACTGKKIIKNMESRFDRVL